MTIRTSAERTSFLRLAPISSGRAEMSPSRQTRLALALFTLAFLSSRPDLLSVFKSLLCWSLYRILRRLIRWRILDDIAHKISDGQKWTFSDCIMTYGTIAYRPSLDNQTRIRVFSDLSQLPHRHHPWIVDDLGDDAETA